MSMGGRDDRKEQALTFRVLYDASFDRVWRLLLRLGVREADREDLTQDVFVIAATRWSEFDGGSEWAWLSAIAVRVAANYRRRPRQQKESVEEVVGADVIDHRPGVHEALAAREARATLMRALSTLSDEQRETVVLHDLEGHAAPEISKMLAVPLNTVYSRLRLGRQALARFVEGEDRKRGTP